MYAIKARPVVDQESSPAIPLVTSIKNGVCDLTAVRMGRKGSECVCKRGEAYSEQILTAVSHTIRNFYNIH